MVWRDGHSVSMEHVGECAELQESAEQMLGPPRKLETALELASEPGPESHLQVVELQSRIHRRAALHLSPVEKGKREQRAVLRQIQELMQSQQRKLNGLHISDSRTAFAAMDRDDSGTLDRGEFATAIRRLGLGLTNAQIESLMRSLDRDGNGTIDYEAWLDYMLTDFSDTSDMSAQAEPDEPRRAILACKRELRNLSLHSLMLLARSAGVEDQDIQSVNWRPDLESLIQRKFGELRHKLEGMSLREVQIKAEEFGIAKHRLEAAEERAEPKLALIDLMITHELKRAPQRLQDHERDMEQQLRVAEQAEAKAKEQAAQALQKMQDHERDMEQQLRVAARVESDLESLFVLQQRVSTLEDHEHQQAREAWSSDEVDMDGFDLTQKLQGAAEEGTPPLDMFDHTEAVRDTQLNALHAVMELMSPPK